MAIADRGKSRLLWLPRLNAAGQLMTAGLLLCFAYSLPVSSQSKVSSRIIDLAQLELDNGNYAKAIELAQTVANDAGPTKPIVAALDTILVAQIAQQKYGEAATTLENYSNLVALKFRSSIKSADESASVRFVPIGTQVSRGTATIEERFESRAK